MTDLPWNQTPQFPFILTTTDKMKGYPKEVRREAARQHLLGRPVEDIAQEIGCTTRSVYGWAKKLRKELDGE